MNCLVTGGTGFIGSNVARVLAEDGHDVTVYDYLPSGSQFDDVEGQLEVVLGDVRQTETLTRVIVENDVDAIVHMAAIVRPQTEENPGLAVDVNCAATTKLFELASALDVDRIVFASSILAYGFTDDSTGSDSMVAEDGALRPTGIYGACKVHNENVAAFYSGKHDLACAGLRFGTVIGSGRERGGTTFVSEMIERSVAGEPVTVRGRDVEPNWLHVEDAAQAVRRALVEHDSGFDVFNVRGEIASIGEAVRIVEREVDAADIRLSEDLPENIHGGYVRMDGSKARDELNFRPEYDLETSIKEYIRSIS